LIKVIPRTTSASSSRKRARDRNREPAFTELAVAWWVNRPSFIEILAAQGALAPDRAVPPHWQEVSAGVQSDMRQQGRCMDCGSPLVIRVVRSAT
jgi:hypothetical protein